MRRRKPAVNLYVWEEENGERDVENQPLVSMYGRMNLFYQPLRILHSTEPCLFTIYALEMSHRVSSFRSNGTYDYVALEPERHGITSHKLLMGKLMTRDQNRFNIFGHKSRGYYCLACNL